MDKWEMLQARERDLLEREEKNHKELRKSTKIKEQYQEHFHEAKQFLEGCSYLFHKNNKPYLYESAMDEFSHESRKVITQLENSEETLNKQYRKNQQDLEDIFYKKRKVILDEKENKTEH
ncbi:DUF3958 family protein [Listeria monocytogenes]|uniref:DUF3958 family protein n=1 Tax=Listeria monocytogenes TaxID=1639 RepID=UPI0008752840|nr:DUF3958 family protein [Listeria monocytogenes]EAD0588974.1 hypothetical protein [Listeria monocytogenes]ECP9717643.1 hypothetical protein [Listeria monocytogenes]ECQ6205694.1 hypothetical protein [Listeria monocytogenes]EDN7760829.1 hypothetical protein [Listeria monocytogenes]EIA4161833.1 DUF3958 family protein [Listeria monocytogenes]